MTWIFARADSILATDELSFFLVVTVEFIFTRGASMGRLESPAQLTKKQQPFPSSNSPPDFSGQQIPHLSSWCDCDLCSAAGTWMRRLRSSRSRCEFVKMRGWECRSLV